MRRKLALLATVEAELDSYQTFYAAKADLLRQSGDGKAARTAYQRAIDLSANNAERVFLRKRLSELQR